MIWLAVLIGAAAGLVMVFTLFHIGMLAERSGSAVLLAAVAVFYPVFAAAEGDIAGAIVHLLIFGGFAWLATLGFRKGLHIIAGGLLMHGVFDIGAMAIGTPGPMWWPLFCASLDIVAAIAMIRLLQTGRIAQ